MNKNEKKQGVFRNIPKQKDKMTKKYIMFDALLGHHPYQTVVL